MGKQVVDAFGRGSGYARSGKNRRGKRFARTNDTLNTNSIVITSTP